MVKSWKIIVATLVIYTAGLVTGTFLNDLRSTESTIARKDPMPRGPRDCDRRAPNRHRRMSLLGLIAHSPRPNPMPDCAEPENNHAHHHLYL